MIQILRPLAAAGAAFAALALGTAPGHAFDLRPTVTVLELPADSGGVTLTLRNPRTVELPVTFEVFERTVLEDGEETRSPADGEFLVFPPQAVVPPGGNQAVRVQYVGAAPAASRSFTLYASEVPIDLTQSDSPGVQTVFRIGASVHVAPAGASPEPVVSGVERAGDGVRLTLANAGTRFFYIDDLVLEFDGGEVLESQNLAVIAGRTLVPPEARRTFTIPGVSGQPRVTLRN